MSDIEEYIRKFRDGALTGHDLARLVEEGVISKGDRRKISKKAQSEKDKQVA